MQILANHFPRDFTINFYSLCNVLTIKQKIFPREIKRILVECNKKHKNKYSLPTELSAIYILKITKTKFPRDFQK